MMNKVISKRKLQAQETKKKLLQAARQLYKEYDFENVSVDSIVEAAGVSKGAFYVHFESKNALETILIADYVNEVDLDYHTFLEELEPATPMSDALMALTGKIADVISSEIGYHNMKSLYKAHLTQSIDSDAAMSYGRDLYKAFTKIIEKGVQQEECRTDIPVDILVKHCILAIRGVTFEWCVRYPDFDLREEYLNHFEIILKGISK
jgi:AcrR family transcriptional regulator